jgi:hypothetical protein
MTEVGSSSSFNVPCLEDCGAPKNELDVVTLSTTQVDPLKYFECLTLRF